MSPPAATPGPETEAMGGSGGTTGERTCPDSRLQFCEDFETYAAGPIAGSPYEFKGQLPVIDEARFAGGKKSLHVHEVNGDHGSQLIETAHLPIAGGVTYGRMFVWIEKLPTEYLHWSLFGATGSGVGGESRIGGIMEGSKDPKWIHKWGVGGDHGPKGDWTIWDDDPAGHARPVEVQSWVCIEWVFDQPKSEIRFWKDGVEHPSMRATDVPLPTFDRVWFGIDLYQETPQLDYDVWFDNLALASEKIGCKRNPSDP